MKSEKELLATVVYDEEKRDSLYEQIRLNIREKRKENNISQDAFSLLINQSPSCINKIEKGYCKPNLGTIINICVVLDLKLDDIIPYEYI